MRDAKNRKISERLPFKGAKQQGGERTCAATELGWMKGISRSL